MTALDPTLTNRLFIDYSANGYNHTLLFRYPGAATTPPSGFLESVDDILIEANQFMPENWTFVGSRVATAGSHISNPFAFTPTAFAGLNSNNLSRAPMFVSFVGRSTNGRRVRQTFLGASQAIDTNPTTYGNYRLTPAEAAWVGTMVDLLVASDICAIDGAAVAYKNYANLGYSSYWQKAVRG